MAPDAATFMGNIRASMQRRRQSRQAPGLPTILSGAQPELREALEQRRKELRDDVPTQSSNPPLL